MLSVIELKPDIDPDGGAPVDVAVRSWDIGLQDVSFWYQVDLVPHSVECAAATCRTPHRHAATPP